MILCFQKIDLSKTQPDRPLGRLNCRKVIEFHSILVDPGRALLCLSGGKIVCNRNKRGILCQYRENHCRLRLQCFIQLGCIAS